MKTKILLVAVFVLAASGGASGADGVRPASRVEVIFVEPEKFTDLKDERSDSGRARDHLMAEIRGEIEKVALRYVAEGQHLEIKVTDVDLAGEFEPWLGSQFDDIRIMRDVYAPRMELEFRLTGADGKVISEGKRKLRQLAYMMSSGSPSWDPLRYDKEMLRDWMRREFKRAS